MPGGARPGGRFAFTVCRSRPPCPGVVEPSGKCLEICLIVYVDQGGGQVDKGRGTHRGGRSRSRHTCRRAREDFSVLLSPGERPEDAHARQWIGSSDLPGYCASSWRTDMGGGSTRGWERHSLRAA